MNAAMLCRLALLLLLTAQSLTDLAREEAERRSAIDQQGIQTRTITTIDATQARAESDDSAADPPPRFRKAPREEALGNRRSLKGLKTLLRRLDQSIRKSEREIELCRRRLHAGRWELPKVGRASKTGSDQGDAQKRLQERIEKAEIELKQFRRERLEAYEEGRRAGFLPGELDGKGVVP